MKIKELFIFLFFFSLIVWNCERILPEDSSIVDKTAPEIIETNPADDTYGISKFTKIYITFSEKIKSSSVSKNNILITPDIDFSFEVSGNQLIITPAAPLSDGQRYYFTITSTIQDLSGNSMGYNYGFDFKVAGHNSAQALITFIVDNSTGKNYPLVFIGGSWDKFGDYDSTWNNGKRYVMYDDGQHNDGLAGDGVWGYTLYLTVDTYHYFTWVVDDYNDPDNGYIKSDTFIITSSSPKTETLYLYPPVSITFNYYDIENKVEDSIYIRGDFNDWSLADKMDGPVGANRLFTITKTIKEGTYSYKYYVDGDWNKVNQDNRSLTVNYGETTTVDDYYQGGQEIVFKYYDIESKVQNYIYLKGDFNDWGDANKMEGPYGENRMFRTVVNAVAGNTYSYKYYVDGDWDKVNTDNRSITITSSMTDVSDYYNGAITVTFNYYDLEEYVDTSIHIRGDFNGWTLSYEYQLQQDPVTNYKYSITLELNQGTYSYKYYVDGDWEKVNSANRRVIISSTNSTVINDYYQ